MKKFKYCLFKKWKKKQYKEFLKESNWDFDHSSITDFLYLKLTMMGLQFAKYGVVIREDNVKMIRQIWEARRSLVRYNNAGDIAQELCQTKVREKYGCDYECEITFKDAEHNMRQLEFSCTSKVEDTKEADKYWSSLKVWDVEQSIQSEALEKTMLLISQNLRGWWD